jgi:hypothetical protein
VLISLPTTLRNIELNFLLFKEGCGESYKEPLEKIRDKLPWPDGEIRSGRAMFSERCDYSMSLDLEEPG